MDPVKKATWYIESFLGQVTLDEIAASVGVSRFYLTRAFGITTGRSIMRYVRQRRLSEAALRMAAGEKDILMLATEMSYQSHEAFTRAFREQFGLTPEQVRSQGHTNNLQLLKAINMDNQKLLELDPPQIVNVPEMLFAGITRRYHYEANGDIPAQWNEFNQYHPTISVQTGKAAYGVIHNSDNDGNFDYLTATEVTTFNGLDERYSRLRIPAQRYAIFSCAYHVTQLQSVMQSIFSSWLPESGHKIADAPTLECYRENFDPQTGNGGFEIWLQIK